MQVFTSIEQIHEWVGREIGVTDWVRITQKRVNEFADATGDHQWIHVDVARAEQGPFGGTIAHGYLTLSLVPWLGSMLFNLQTPGAKLNYGVNKVRFPSPVLVGSNIRCRVTINSITPIGSGHQLNVGHVIEIEGTDGTPTDKPACVAETVVLLLP